MQDYKDYIANEVRKNNMKMIMNTPQPEALSTFEKPRMYGGKRVREHPLAGHTAYSDGPSTLTPDGPSLLNRTFNDNYKQYDGAGFFGDVGRELKTGLSKGAKAVFHDVIVPVGTEMAKNFVKSKMSGNGRKPRGRPKKHYVHHDVRMYEPEEDHERVDGAGFWKDFGEGFKKGAVSSLKVGAKVLPYALMAAGREKRSRGRPKKCVEGGNKVFDAIKKGAKSVGRFVAPIGKEIFHDVIVPVGTQLAKDYVKTKMGGVRRRKCVGGSSELYPPAVMRGGAKSGGSRTARGELIKKIMAKNKCTLGQASKYIKENNLH
jgi:hypothetical protein